jgi:hypothetical protein
MWHLQITESIITLSIRISLSATHPFHSFCARIRPRHCEAGDHVESFSVLTCSPRSGTCLNNCIIKDLGGVLTQRPMRRA